MEKEAEMKIFQEEMKQEFEKREAASKQDIEKRLMEKDVELEEHRAHIRQYIMKNAHLEKEALSLFDQKLRLENKFNVRGALERIVFHAELRDPASFKHLQGVQAKHDKLAASDEFKEITRQEIDERKLDPKGVMSSVANIYQSNIQTRAW